MCTFFDDGNNQKFLKETTNLTLVVLVAILLTRIWVVSSFYFLGNESRIAQSIANDPFHHYHLGMVLIVLPIVFRKSRKAMFLASIGLGIFLEEWAIFLKDLGLDTDHLYLTKVDFISVTTLVGLIYILSRAPYIKMRLRNT